MDFGNKFDLNALEPVWKDPASGAELCEAPTSYVLRERQGDEWKNVFQVGRLMCQKPITRENAVQLIEKGKTELITGFISKKGRPFDAYLVRNGAKISWEFPPRKAAAKSANGEAKAPRKPKAPRDLSKATKLGESRIHDGELLQTEDAYVVRKKNADGSDRVVFELKRVLCQKEISPDEVERLVETGKTDLIDGFVSKRGSNFSAYLTISKDKKKAEFEFPPR